MKRFLLTIVLCSFFMIAGCNGGGGSSSDNPAADTTPDAFVLADHVSADLSTEYSGGVVVVAGLGDGASTALVFNAVPGVAVRLEINGVAAINGADVQNGDTWEIFLTSSDSYMTTVVSEVVIGGVSDEISVTTKAMYQVPKTAQTQLYAVGDDGDLELGADTPDPRFTDNGDGTVTDNYTGLVWLKDFECIVTNYPAFDNDANTSAALDGRITWEHALDFVAGMNNGTYPLCGLGFNDWRLPNINELQTLVEIGNTPALPSDHLFDNYGYWSVWSSTPHSDTHALLLATGNGYVQPYNMTTYDTKVMFVRGTATNRFVMKTGITTSYYNGDDGDVQAGTDQPDDRFIDNGDGTVTDKVTGLMWLKDANCSVAAGFDDNGVMTWADGFTFINNMNAGAYAECGAGYDDWHMPNMNEIISLIDYAGDPLTLTPGNPFENTTAAFWTSSTRKSSTGYAYYVNMSGTNLYTLKTSASHNVWPVRDTR